MTEYQIIIDNVPRQEILAQLAEECSELAQAALKLRRAICISNPTPVSEDDAENKMREEIADVLTCIEVAGDYLYDVSATDEIRHIKAVKMARWAWRVQLNSPK